MSLEHYFSANPKSVSKRHKIVVQLLKKEYELVSVGGIFSPHRVDLGTQVLLQTAPMSGVVGDVLDIGCGWGPISLSLSLFSPQSTVWAVDVNQRCLDVVAENAKLLGLSNVKAMLPENVSSDLCFDAIWSNPPIRVGKTVLHEILLHWLPRLKHNGLAWLVVQRNLGADSLQFWLEQVLDEKYSKQFVVKRFSSSKGFRVLEVKRVGKV